MRKERKIILITGKTGTGKTKLVKQLVGVFPKVIILDTIGEYSESSYIIYDSFNDLCLHRLHNTLYDYTVVLRDFDENDIEFICQYAKIHTDVCIVIEEFEKYVENLNSFPELEDVIRRGRHYDVSMIVISQRVPDFPPTVRSQISTFITFKQDEPIDLKHLQDRGFIPDEVMNLQRCEGLEKPIENKHFLLRGDNIVEIKKWCNKRKEKEISLL